MNRRVGRGILKFNNKERKMENLKKEIEQLKKERNAVFTSTLLCRRCGSGDC